MLSFQNANFLVVLGEIYIVVMIVRAVLSWFPYDPTSPLNGVRRVVFALTEPVLAPVRRIIPPVGMMDISFMIVFLVLQFIVIPLLARVPV